MSPWVSVCFLQAQSDERLLAAARLGHERAFETVVRRHRKRLHSHARRLLPDAMAEDALQQGLLQAWKALQRGADVQNARAWLYRIVHNAALDLLRKSGHDHELLGDQPHSPDAWDHPLDRRLAARDALAALASLPDTQREVLRRTVMDGDSYDRVADDLGLSEGSVRGLIYRARLTLRAAASALTPSQLLEWAVRSERHGTRLSGRLTGAGGGPVSAVVIKGTAAAVTVGALSVGVTVVHHRPSPTLRARTPSELSGERSASATPSSQHLFPTDRADTPLSQAAALTSSRLRARGHSAHADRSSAPDRATGGLGNDRSDSAAGALGPESYTRIQVGQDSSGGSDGKGSGGNTDGGPAGTSGGSGTSGDGGSPSLGTEVSNDGGGGGSGSDGGGGSSTSGGPAPSGAGTTATTASAPGGSDPDSGSSDASPTTTTSTSH
jgi:RNA polymerase sigma factor (sigma-70 family)